MTTSRTVPRENGRLQQKDSTVPPSTVELFDRSHQPFDIEGQTADWIERICLRHKHGSKGVATDLGRDYTIRGFRYLARQDNGWNGTVKDCEFYVGGSPDELDALAAKATLRKVKTAQEVKCKPVRGRYVLLRALSEITGGPWASAAELGVIGE